MKQMRKVGVLMLASLMLMVGCDRSPQANSDTSANVGGVQTGGGGKPGSVTKTGGGAGGGGVATIDLDKIATGMGWFDDMQRKVGSVEQELTVKLDSLRQQLDTTLRDEHRRMGDKPTQEQQDRLAAMQLVAQRQMQEAQAQLQLQSQQTLQQVIGQYRDLVRPVARRVAEQKGYTVIVLPTDAIFWSDPAADLTDAVMDELQRTGVKPSLDTQPDTAGSTGPQPTPGKTTP